MADFQNASSEEWRRMRRLVSYGVLAVVALVAVSTGLWALFGAGPWVGYRWFGFGWVGAVFGFLFLFWVLRWVFWPVGPYRLGYWRHPVDDSVAILRKRYARGEVTKEQFAVMLRDLRGHELED